jgi:dTDP-4-dehydrorhamnose reductase
MVIRTSAFFGPWDSHNFVTLALKTLRSGTSFAAANDLVVSPTYVPDLVNTSLDLLIDKEKGIWHLSNAQAISWADLAYKVCEMTGFDSSMLESLPHSALNFSAPRPLYCALGSERGVFMPALDDALQRYLWLLEKTVGVEDYFGKANIPAEANATRN